MLNTLYISSESTRPASCISLKMGGASHADSSNRAPSPSGRIRGTFSGSPPPVMCAMPLMRGSAGSSSG